MSLLECAAKSRHESAKLPVIVAALLPPPGTASAAGATLNTPATATRIAGIVRRSIPCPPARMSSPLPKAKPSGPIACSVGRHIDEPHRQRLRGALARGVGH